jgi:hypothetical protein
MTPTERIAANERSRRPRLLCLDRHRVPARAAANVTVRCFAQPDAHQHGDRSPSCSVSLASGAWECHGCGARGGAYDAARETGRSPRSAMDLLIAHGLAEPRAAVRQTAPWSTKWSTNAESTPQDDLKLLHHTRKAWGSRAFLHGHGWA